jgi:hypothetical protein
MLGGNSGKSIEDLSVDSLTIFQSFPLVNRLSIDITSIHPLEEKPPGSLSYQVSPFPNGVFFNFACFSWLQQP